MRSLIKSASPARGTSVANRISDINLNCALNATFGVYRCGDLFAEYHRLGIRNAVIDGFHETSTGDGYTIGPITYVGTGTPPVVQVVPAPYTAPLVGGGAETLTVEVVAGGSLGTAIFAISYSGGAPGAQVTSLPGGNYNVQFPTSLTGIGVIWQFGAGTYASGATFSCTVTSISQLNDNAQFRDCVIDGCGLIFGTSTMLGPTQYQGFGFNLQTATPLTGTVTMTQGSSTISGSGTNFTITGARTGDFIRFGFPAWQAGSMYSAGNYVTAPGPAAGTAAAAPGLLFVWQCMTTHTAVAPITWPTQGNLPGSSPIGETVADGAGNIWTFMAYTTYQILDVQDDQTILIGEFCAPANTISSVDYAICVGSGSFDEISEDVSENSWIGGSITSAAAAGLMTVAPFGMKAQSMQCQSCGAVGFAIGLAGIECKNCVLDEVYCEANFAADYWCECSGLTLIQPELGTLNGGVVCPDASGASYGTWIGNVGNAQSTVAMQPIGTFSYSTMPVTGSSKQLFSFAGPLAVLPNTQEIG
jgi:hypothetical protein